MGMNEGALIRAIDAISDADQDETAQLVIAALSRLGEHGRPAAEATLAKAQELSFDDRTYFEEGLCQIESVEGVLTGRTDSL